MRCDWSKMKGGWETVDTESLTGLLGALTGAQDGLNLIYRVEGDDEAADRLADLIDMVTVELSRRGVR